MISLPFCQIDEGIHGKMMIIFCIKLEYRTVLLLHVKRTNNGDKLL